MFQGNREESTGDVDVRAARADAEILFNSGEKVWGTDESEFNRILVSKSIKHLRRVFTEYQFLASKDIEASISSEFSGDICMGLLSVGAYIIIVIRYIYMCVDSFCKLCYTFVWN